MNICFFQANLDTGHSNSVSMSGRSYDNNSFLISINQLALFDDLIALCRLAKRFSTVFSGRQILLKKSSRLLYVFVPLWAIIRREYMELGQQFVLEVTLLF